MKPTELWLLASRVTMAIYATLLMAASLIDLSEQSIETSDKLLHALAYGLFTILAYSASRHWKQFLSLCLGIFCYGLLIEGLQGLTPTRSLSLADALANAAGIGLAFAVCLQFERRFQQSG